LEQNLTKGANLKIINFLETSEREVFILRVWKPLEQNAPLRGQIQHVRSGITFSLREPENILLFMQEQVEATKKKSIPSGIK
jgi:hypothetical protein